MTNSGGRDRFFSNDGEYLDCFSCRTKAVEGWTCIDGLCTETRSANPSSDDAWEHRVGIHTDYSSGQDRRRRGEKDCRLYGKCCFFDCLRQVRKQLGGVWSPCFSYALDCVLKLKDAKDAAADAKKEAQHGPYTTLTHSYVKCLDGADISMASYLVVSILKQAKGEWSDIGSESDCGTTYILFGSVSDMHNMKMAQSSQAVIRAHFVEVLSNLKEGTICFQIQGKEVVSLSLLLVSSSSLSNRYLLQSSCLLPNHGDEAILSSAFLDTKCYSLNCYPKGNLIHHLQGILKGDFSYQQMRVSKRSNGGHTAGYCRPRKKACIGHGNVASKVNAGIGALIIDKEEKEDFPRHSQSNTQLWWTESKNSSEHLLTKQKEEPCVVENKSGSTFVDVTHHERLESYGNSSKKLQHGLDTQKCQSKSQYLFDVVDKIQQTSDLGATCREDSEASKKATKKGPNPWHSAVLDRRESSILDVDSATFSKHVAESCLVAGNFPNQRKKVTSVEDAENKHIFGLTCQDSLNLHKVSTKNQLPFHHGSDQDISDPLLPDEDYKGFLNQIRSDGRHASNLTSKPKEPSDLVQKDQMMSSPKRTRLENSNENACTAKTQVGVRSLYNKEAKLMDGQLDGDMSGLIWDESDVFLSANWDQNRKMKQEDSQHVGSREQPLTDYKFVSHTFCVGKERKSSSIGEKDKDFESPAGIKAEKDVKKDEDYEEFLRNSRKHGRSYVLEVTDTEKKNLVVHRYEKYEDEGLLPQNMESRKHTVMLKDVKRAESDPSNELSSDEKHLDNCLKIRRSPRLMQFTERKTYSPHPCDRNMLANSRQHMTLGLDPFDNEAPGNFSYSFDCGRLDSFSESLHAVLRKPYDRKEHKELIEEANRHKPVTRERNLRGHSKTYFTQKLGLSYMDHYPDLHQRVRVADDGQQLKLLRGFFFWLQNSCREDSFLPWLPSTSKGDVVHIDE